MTLKPPSVRIHSVHLLAVRQAIGIKIILSEITAVERRLNERASTSQFHVKL